jgi:2',3'-cyclic-nucleotide 2'-phosphodiesterase (5'-nucleotidase family)
MNNRRRFIQQSTLAATALIAAKPFKAIAGINTSINGFTSPYKHLIFLHTAETDLAAYSSTLQYINAIKNRRPHTILANTSETQPASLHYDVVHAATEEKGNEQYTIISKAGVRTAVIQVKPEIKNVINATDQLAAMLKKEKNCQLVVCVSQLGYKQKNAADDMTLAAQSENIDIIISGHSSNFLPKTITVANRKRQEVLIQSSKGNKMACGKIEIGFDANGIKNHLHIGTQLAKNPGVFQA